MKGLRNLGQASDAPKRPWKQRVFFWLAGGVMGAALVVTAAYYFDVATESAEFCGLLCHANTPQYVTHEVSDHARVECGTCHIGPGLTPKVTAKIYGVGELVSMLTDSYERPIAPPVERLRPAREICEQCHWSEKFYADRVRRHSHFVANEENSETQTYLILRTGGGAIYPGQEPAIHWHIENPVWYVARDAQRQDIPWVGTMDSDGELVEYWSQDDELTPEELENLPRREMDCLDCHNRVTHVFRQPALSVDEALANDRIDRSLPYIKREAMGLLSISYPTQEAGLKAMEELEQFYRSQYPDVYAAKQQAVGQAVEALQDIYRHTIFPEMNVTWQVYADNIGHTDFPGCFRCHDGKHLNAEGDSIRLHCNICHSIPVVTNPDQEPDLTDIISFIAQVKREPDSHTATNFIRDHRFQANESCASCHGSIQFGDDNDGFCANRACHGQKWPEVDLDAAFPHPIELEGQHVQALCYECHRGVEQPPREDCVACHQPTDEPHYGPDCSQCHTPEGWRESAVSWTTDVPPIPHRVEDAMDCLLCHAEGEVKPVPTTHGAIPGEACVQCHQAGPVAGGSEIPHDLEMRDDCLACHRAGGPEPTTADHEGRPNESCLLCHKVQK